MKEVQFAYMNIGFYSGLGRHLILLLRHMDRREISIVRAIAGSDPRHCPIEYLEALTTYVTPLLKQQWISTSEYMTKRVLYQCATNDVRLDFGALERVNLINMSIYNIMSVRNAINILCYGFGIMDEQNVKYVLNILEDIIDDPDSDEEMCDVINDLEHILAINGPIMEALQSEREEAASSFIADLNYYTGCSSKFYEPLLAAIYAAQSLLIMPNL